MMKIGIKDKKRYARYKMYEVDGPKWSTDLQTLRSLIAKVARHHGVPEKVVGTFARG